MLNQTIKAANDRPYFICAYQTNKLGAQKYFFFLCLK